MCILIRTLLVLLLFPCIVLSAPTFSGGGGAIDEDLENFAPDGTLSDDVFVVTDGDGKANDGPAINTVIVTDADAVLGTVTVDGLTVPQGTTEQSITAFEASANGTEYVTLKAPASLATSPVYEFRADGIYLGGTIYGGGGTWGSITGTLSDQTDLQSALDAKQAADANLPTWPSAVSATEVGYLDGATSNIQAQIDGISVGSPLVSAPTYSDETCTAGTFAIGTNPSLLYCKATNTWDYQVVSGTDLVWAGWSNPTPTPPTLTSATVASDGDSLSFVYSRAVTATTTADLCDDYSVSFANTGANTLSYTSGDTTATVVCAASPTIQSDASGDTISVASYTQGTIVSNDDSTAMENIADFTSSVTNSSSQSGLTAGFIGLDGTPEGPNFAADSVDEGVYDVYTTTTPGLINTICVYTSSIDSSSSFNVGLYSSDGTTLLADGTETAGFTTDNYTCVTLDSSYEISAATSYMLVAGTSNDTYWQVGRSLGGNGWQYVVPMVIGNTMPATISGGSTNAGYDLHIYGTYQ